jgi:hypothetical protein
MTDHVHFFNYATGRPRFHFDEASDAAAASAAAAAAAAAQPWHGGKVDADTIGFWQNKGYDVNDPVKLASELTKQYRAAETFIGAPPERIHKMPKNDAKPEEFAAFWQGLGAPKEAKEYDFSGVKMNGQPLDEAFTATMRDALAAAFVPKDKAATITAAVAKMIESKATADSSVNAARMVEEKAKLAVNWGPKFDFNHLQAMEGARRAGITPEAVKLMENQAGYAAVMEHFRKIGANTSEDTFVERAAGAGNNGVNTREGAVSRKNELMSDPAWAKRFTAGGAEERREYDRLNAMIGEAA